MHDTRRVLLMANAAAGYDRDVLKGVGQYANSVNAWFCRTYGSFNEDDYCTNLIAEWKPTGVISLTRGWTPPLEMARSLGIPVVQAHETDEEIGRVPAPCIFTDGRLIASLVVDYYVGRGLKSIGYIGSNRGLPLRHGKHLCAEAQRRGIAFCSYFGDARGNVDLDRKFRRWLSDQPRRTGLFASSDWYAWNAMTECMDAGFNVPDDFAFIGLGDDSPWCALATVPLSSVAMAAEKIGYRAASMLDQLMRGLPVSNGVIEIPPTGIVTRRSTEVIAADDPDIAAALRYIHNHAAEGCTVKEVLQAVAIDRRRLERWCRQKLDRSPLDEIQRLRVASVKRLLAETDERIEEIARMSGFGSATVLCRAFQRETGETLARYRRQFKKARGQSEE